MGLKLIIAFATNLSPMRPSVRQDGLQIFLSSIPRFSTPIPGVSSGAFGRFLWLDCRRTCLAAWQTTRGRKFDRTTRWLRAESSFPAGGRFHFAGSVAAATPWGLVRWRSPASRNRSRLVLKTPSGCAERGLPKTKKPVAARADNRFSNRWWLGQALALALSARAAEAFPARAAKASASLIAISERTLRSNSIPAALRPSMRRE